MFAGENGAGFNAIQMSQTEQILIKSRVRPTRNRIAVLDIFMRDHKSLSHSRLSSLLDQHIDRVSLYRTLIDLVNAGVLSRLVDSEGVAQFHLSQNTTSESLLMPHFRCRTCEEITALPDLPPSYVRQISNCGQIEQSRLLLEGICLECSQVKIQK